MAAEGEQQERGDGFCCVATIKRRRRRWVTGDTEVVKAQKSRREDDKSNGREEKERVERGSLRVTNECESKFLTHCKEVEWSQAFKSGYEHEKRHERRTWQNKRCLKGVKRGRKDHPNHLCPSLFTLLLFCSVLVNEPIERVGKEGARQHLAPPASLSSFQSPLLSHHDHFLFLFPTG